MGDIATVIGGGTPSAKDPSNFTLGAGYPWLTPADLSGFQGLHVSRGGRNLTAQGLRNSSATLMPRGAVLMSSRAPIGYLAVAANEIATNQGFKSFICAAEFIPEYVYFWLKHITPTLQEMGSGSTFAEISGAKAREIPVRFPPPAEQRRIVEMVDGLLGGVNIARDRVEKVSRILKRFRQSLLAAACSGRLTEDFRNSLGDPRPQLPLDAPPSRRRRSGANLSGDGDLVIDAELPELPETWIYARADQIVARGTIITYGIVLPGSEVPGGVPYVRQLDIAEGGIRTEQLRHTSLKIAAKHQKSALQEGDVLLCIIRNLRVAIVPPGIDGANITQGAVRLRPEPNLVLPDYLAAYLSSTYAQGWMRRRYFGMDMPRINVEDARAIPIALPPIAEQREIVRRMKAQLEVLEKVEARLSIATRTLHSTSSAVLEKAFRGELVATEAEMARADGRRYESAESLLARIQSDRIASGHTLAGIRRSARRAGARP
jgi:type I restriction enzyme S subunit